LARRPCGAAAAKQPSVTGMDCGNRPQTRAVTVTVTVTVAESSGLRVRVQVWLSVTVARPVSGTQCLLRLQSYKQVPAQPGPPDPDRAQDLSLRLSVRTGTGMNSGSLNLECRPKSHSTSKPTSVCETATTPSESNSIPSESNQAEPSPPGRRVRTASGTGRMNLNSAGGSLSLNLECRPKIHSTSKPT